MTAAEPDPVPEAVAGQDIQSPTAARQWAVFLTSVLLVGALIALVLLAIELPTCEDPPNSWAPCVGP